MDTEAFSDFRICILKFPFTLGWLPITHHGSSCKAAIDSIDRAHRIFKKNNRPFMKVPLRNACEVATNTSCFSAALTWMIGSRNVYSWLHRQSHSEQIETSQFQQKVPESAKVGKHHLSQNNYITAHYFLNN